MPREPRVLTEEEINKVEELGGYLTQSQLAHYLGISTDCFEDICKRQPDVERIYKKAKAKKVSYVASKLMDNIEMGKETSIIFFLKTQAGWKETQEVELTSWLEKPTVTLIATNAPNN